MQDASRGPAAHIGIGEYTFAITIVKDAHQRGGDAAQRYVIEKSAAPLGNVFKTTASHPAPLQAFDQYLREATQRLGRRIDDLDDVKAVVAALREVREYEAGVDAVVGPIEDMSALLAR